jgi:type 1 fimbriae regulatory protein FimB
MTNAAPIISIDTGLSLTSKPKCAKCAWGTNSKGKAVVTDPCPRHTRKYQGGDHVSLTADQMEKFLRAAEARGKRELALFLFGFVHGCRISEVANAKLADLHFDSHTVTIRRVKGSKNSQPKFLRDAFGYDEEKVLREYIEHDRRSTIGADASPLFLSQKTDGEGNARPLTTTQLYRLFVSIARDAGIPELQQHPHVMRHSMGFLLRKSGARLETIQQVLGHVNINSTAIYSKASQEEADEQVDQMFQRMNHKKI